MSILLESQKKLIAQMLATAQTKLIAAIEAVDGIEKFTLKPWQRPEGGEGVMSVMRGAVVEKSGVNYSAVHGDSYPALEGEHKGKPFFATGISTISHMFNPYAPIGHMNVRILEVGDKLWFGGGADLTPFMPFDSDTQQFHQSLKKACDRFDPDAYEKYSAWCKEYFYITHRKSERGVGGIFFDYLTGEFDKLLMFITEVVSAYTETFPEILHRRKNTAFSEEEKDAQLYWRGRYAEFNLVYDRGTKFGLMTGGNMDAIFVSMPPVVKW